jgi:uncharacterized glyoxalase superfamily protein PhnB
VPDVEGVIPVIVCSDIQLEHDFLVESFGFESGGIQVDGDGNAVHGEVIAGGTRIWLHAVSPAHRMDSPKDMNHGGFVIHVPDVDQHFARVRNTKARIESEPTDQDYGQREYGATDPEGHRWWFATQT